MDPHNWLFLTCFWISAHKVNDAVNAAEEMQYSLQLKSFILTTYLVHFMTLEQTVCYPK